MLLSFLINASRSQYHGDFSKVGGVDEYQICKAIKEKKITKPVVAWVLGTCADMFNSEVSESNIRHMFVYKANIVSQTVEM